MSQCYHAELKESVCRVVRGADAISYPIELTEILPQDEMKDLLREELINAGWVESTEGDSIFVNTGSSGEVLTIDLETMELTATLESEREVTAEATVKISAETQSEANRHAAQELQTEKQTVGGLIEDTGTREIQKDVTEKLAESESSRQRTMHELLQRVYAESLKRKARQLGDVMEIMESTSEDGDYELTIRIEQ